jgi:hypothetical protein
MLNFNKDFYSIRKYVFFHGVFLSVDLRVKRFNVTIRDTYLKCCSNFDNFS